MASEEKLIGLLKKIARENDYDEERIEIKAITSGGSNYTTNLYLATISASEKEELNLFAKVANLDEEIRANSDVMANVYEVESMFYKEIALNFERLYKENNVPVEERLKIPVYYGDDLTRLKEVTVLENLEAKGFSSFDRLKTFDWEYAKTAVSELAKFHALGMAFREDNPEAFQRVSSRFGGDYTKDHESSMKFFIQAVENCCEVLSEELREMLLGYLESESLKDINTLMVTDKTMMLHGDFRPSNLMHRKRDGKLEIIPVDYQTLKLGNPVTDLMHLIVSGSDEEFRRHHYEELLELYYERLVAALKNLSIDADEMYPRETYDRDLKAFKPMGLIIAISMMAVLTVDEAAAPRMEGDVSSLVCVKLNALAAARIAGIVRDFAR